MLELVLARHGQSHGNLDRSLGPDTDLTDLGYQQATRLRDWLFDQQYRFTTLYASPLRRACRTAEIVNARYGLEIVLDPDLREAEVPYLDVMPQRGVPLGSEPPPPFERAYEQMRERVARATARILTENPDGEVLVVAHSGTLGTMLRTILGAHTLLVRTEMASIHCLRWQDGLWNLQYANRLEHLRPHSGASTREPRTP